MKTSQAKGFRTICLLATGLISIVTATGCGFTTQVAGQALPSPYYLRDDVQFFPAGPEDRLPLMRAELERYKIEQESVQSDLAEPAP